MATSIQGTRKRMNESNGRLSASSAKSAICEETVKLCTKAYGDRLGAIVLAGSLARNEGTFVQRDGHCALLGDADLFLVFRDNANMPPASEVACLGKSIEARLIEDGIKGTIGSSNPFAADSELRGSKDRSGTLGKSRYPFVDSRFFAYPNSTRRRLANTLQSNG